MARHKASWHTSQVFIGSQPTAAEMERRTTPQAAKLTDKVENLKDAYGQAQMTSTRLLGELAKLYLTDVIGDKDGSKKAELDQISAKDRLMMYLAYESFHGPADKRARRRSIALTLAEE